MNLPKCCWKAPIRQQGRRSGLMRQIAFELKGPTEKMPTKNKSRIRFQLLGAVLLASFSIGAQAQCPANGLAFVVNQANATEGFSIAQLRRLLLGDLRNWPDKKKVSLITPNPQSAMFKCVLSAVVRMSDSEYHRFIASMGFR
jgi:hypothetical protein